jgi:hypothetical protein
VTATIGLGSVHASRKRRALDVTEIGPRYFCASSEAGDLGESGRRGQSWRYFVISVYGILVNPALGQPVGFPVED